MKTKPQSHFDRNFRWWSYFISFMVVVQAFTRVATSFQKRQPALDVTKVHSFCVELNPELDCDTILDL